MSEFLSQSSSRPRGFLGLPLELREEISFRLLLFNDDVDVQFHKFKADGRMMPNWQNYKQQALRGGMEYVVPKKTGILLMDANDVLDDERRAVVLDKRTRLQTEQFSSMTRYRAAENLPGSGSDRDSHIPG